MHTLRHDAECNALTELFHPEVEDRFEVVVKVRAGPVRLKVAPAGSEVNDISHRQRPRVRLRLVTQAAAAGKIEAHAGVEENGLRTLEEDLAHLKRGRVRRRRDGCRERYQKGESECSHDHSSWDTRDAAPRFYC